MSKVKVTKKQANVIDNFKDGFDNIMRGLTYDDFIKAVKEGYEVEPEFKTKDFVIYHHAMREKRVGEIIDIQHEHNRVQFFLTSGWRSIDDIIRHATPSEIAEEKERRWWKKYGRNPWELKKSDVLSINDEVLEIESIGELSITFEDNYWITMKEFESLKHNIRIVCFKENRLDVKTNE